HIVRIKAIDIEKEQERLDLFAHAATLGYGSRIVVGWWHKSSDADKIDPPPWEPPTVPLPTFAHLRVMSQNRDIQKVAEQLAPFQQYFSPHFLAALDGQVAIPPDDPNDLNTLDAEKAVIARLLTGDIIREWGMVKDSWVCYRLFRLWAKLRTRLDPGPLALGGNPDFRIKKTRNGRDHHGHVSQRDSSRRTDLCCQCAPPAPQVWPGPLPPRQIFCRAHARRPRSRHRILVVFPFEDLAVRKTDFNESMRRHKRRYGLWMATRPDIFDFVLALTNDANYQGIQVWDADPSVDPVEIVCYRGAGVRGLDGVTWSAQSGGNAHSGQFEVTDRLLKRVGDPNKILTELEASQAAIAMFDGVLPCAITTQASIRAAADAPDIATHHTWLVFMTVPPHGPFERPSKLKVASNLSAAIDVKLEPDRNDAQPYGGEELGDVVIAGAEIANDNDSEAGSGLERPANDENDNAPPDQNDGQPDQNDGEELGDVVMAGAEIANDIVSEAGSVDLIDLNNWDAPAPAADEPMPDGGEPGPHDEIHWSDSEPEEPAPGGHQPANIDGDEPMLGGGEPESAMEVDEQPGNQQSAGVDGDEQMLEGGDGQADNQEAEPAIVLVKLEPVESEDDSELENIELEDPEAQEEEQPGPPADNQPQEPALLVKVTEVLKKFKQDHIKSGKEVDECIPVFSSSGRILPGKATIQEGLKALTNTRGLESNASHLASFQQYLSPHYLVSRALKMWSSQTAASQTPIPTQDLDREKDTILKLLAAGPKEWDMARYAHLCYRLFLVSTALARRARVTLAAGSSPIAARVKKHLRALISFIAGEMPHSPEAAIGILAVFPFEQLVMRTRDKAAMATIPRHKRRYGLWLATRADVRPFVVAVALSRYIGGYINKNAELDRLSRRPVGNPGALLFGSDEAEFKHGLNEILRAANLTTIQRWMPPPPNPIDTCTFRQRVTLSLPPVVWSTISGTKGRRGTFRVSEGLLERVADSKIILSEEEMANAVIALFHGVLPWYVVTATEITSADPPELSDHHMWMVFKTVPAQGLNPKVYMSMALVLAPRDDLNNIIEVPARGCSMSPARAGPHASVIAAVTES
ncbi:hypothetical protein QBC39DRAFT_409355, partial [Podospora conica]